MTSNLVICCVKVSIENCGNAQDADISWLINNVAVAVFVP